MADTLPPCVILDHPALTSQPRLHWSFYLQGEYDIIEHKQGMCKTTTSLLSTYRADTEFMAASLQTPLEQADYSVSFWQHMLLHVLAATNQQYRATMAMTQARNNPPHRQATQAPCKLATYTTTQASNISHNTHQQHRPPHGPLTKATTCRLLPHTPVIQASTRASHTGCHTSQ